jgi:anti-sigma factor RsiW
MKSETQDRMEETKILLVKAADGTLTEEERQVLDAHAAQDATIEAELKELKNTKRLLAQFLVRDPNPDDWDRFEKSLGSRTSRALGWLLILGGYLTVLIGVLYFLFIDPEAPVVIKVAIGSIVLGFTVLLVYVGHRFSVEHKRDPYKNIVR